MTRAETVRRGRFAWPTWPVERAPGTDGRLAHIITTLIIAAFVANTVYLAALLIPGAPASGLIDYALSIVCQWLPVSIFWLVAARTRFGRWEVNLAAAAMTFNLAAETYYVVAMDTSGYLPSPSFADVGYLVTYPLTMAALIVLVRRTSRRVTGSVIFDATLAALGASAVLAVVLLPVFEDAAGGDSLESIIAVLYPICDILLVAVVVGISASPALHKGPGWQFLIAGLLLFAAADIAYALLVLEDAYVGGTPLDAAWSFAVALVALWINGIDRVRPSPRADDHRVRMLPIPSLAVLAGLAVLLFATQATVPTVALVLAAATVALSAVPVMFRQATLARLLASQERVVERLTALDKSKSDIIGTVSHEMRTPLTSILGFQELVLNDAAGPIPDEAKDLLRVANRNARRLENMVGNMLVMSRLESGGGLPVVTPVAVGRVLTRVAESLQLFAESRAVRLEIASDDSAVIEGDESQIERIFTNLVENAIKFTPEQGRVRVEAAPGAAVAGEPSILVTVADTGMGIPADEIPHVFDRFFRAANARENVVQGTGLGLSIVRQIVQAHHGEITVTSGLGEGTTFHVTLPVHQPAGV